MEENASVFSPSHVQAIVALVANDDFTTKHRNKALFSAMFEIAPPLPLTQRRSRTRTMQAMLWQQEGGAVEASIPLPHLRPGQLLIRALGYGLSVHDFKAWRRTSPALPGAPAAEGWGVVERAGAGAAGFEVGQAVAFFTQRGFAEYAVADMQSALPLPPSLYDTPFLLRSVAGVVNLFRRSEMNAGDLVAIVGGGFLGLLSAQLTALAEARTIVVTRSEFSRRQALALGASAVLPADATTLSRLQRFTGGKLCDFVIESGGAAPTLQLASELTCARGRLIIAGHHPASRAVNLPLWSERGLDIINAHEPSPSLNLECMREAVSAVAAGLLTPGPLYTHRYPLARVHEALQCAASRPEGFLKALIHTQPCHTLRPPASIATPRVF